MGLKLKKAGGGGFLSGETATITGITFDEKTWGEGEKKKYRTLSAEIKILRDNGEEVSQFLPAGFLYEGQTISADGLTLEDDNVEAVIVGADSDFGRFLQTLVEAGLPEETFDEGDSRNFEALAGYRVTFGKELNKDRQMAAGRKKLGAKAKTASDEDIMKAGRRQDKNDKSKSYNHDRLIVTAIVGKQEDAPKGKKAAAAAKSGAAKSGKANGAAKSASNDDSAMEAAEGVLLSLLADAEDNTISKKSLSSLVVRKALADGMKTAEREALRKLMGSDEFLARNNGWTFDAESKAQTIALT